MPPYSNLKTYVLVDDNAMIHAIEKHHGCDNFGHYAYVIIQSIARHFTGSATRVYRCCKLFQLCPKLVSSVVRDGPIDVIETSV